MTLNETMKLGAAYRKEARERGLIFDFRNRPEEGQTTFNFYINTNGDMETVSDPFQLAKLILLGVQFEDRLGYGDHKILLNSFASVKDLNTPDASRSWSCVMWDYETAEPCMSLEVWLVNELNSKTVTMAQKQIRHELMVFLAKVNETPLSFAEKYLWWL